MNNQLKIWLLCIYLLITIMIVLGGLTRLTDSGLSITKWELFKGFFPPLNNQKWLDYFDLYKKIPEYKLQNYDMTINEFKFIFWWEWAHRFLGRLIGLSILIPMLYFVYKNGIKTFKEYLILFILVCIQGFVGWYMVSSGLIDRIDVSHYRLSLHLFLAFLILSLVYWKYLKLSNIQKFSNVFKPILVKIFLILLFIQLIIGALVSGMDAGKIYNTWPLMGSSYFPDDNKFINIFSVKVFDDASIVQFFHRNLAYLILLFYIYFFIVTLKKKIKILYNPIILIGLSLLLQIVLGILIILSGAKIYYASLHQINSILLISSSVYFLFLNNLRT